MTLPGCKGVVSLGGFRAHTVLRSPNWLGGGMGGGEGDRPAAISAVELDSVFTFLSHLPCVGYFVIKL